MPACGHFLQADGEFAVGIVGIGDDDAGLVIVLHIIAAIEQRVLPFLQGAGGDANNLADRGGLVGRFRI